jgi:glycosyltransferase involved in cell wall biosynthesis
LKKIGLFLGSDPARGGVFQYSQTVLDATTTLPDDDISVTVVYAHDGWSKIVDSHAKLKKISLPVMPWDGPLRMLWRFCDVSTWRKIYPLFHPLARRLQQEECDLWIFPASDEWSYKFPVPALVSIHDLMHRYEKRFPEVGSALEYRGREESIKNICRWARGILVDSLVGKQQVIESYGVAPGMIHILPFIAPQYMHRKHSVNDFERRYNLPDKFLFYPAQFWEHKNHKGLIQAIAKLKTDIPAIKLVLAGSKKNGYASAFRLIHDLRINENVIFLNYVPDDDMPEIYRRARALVMPTFFGPTNIPPLEAFVSGCPVAVSNVYGMPEQVGDAALLFNPGSIDEIAESIRKLWVDDALCAELSRRGSLRAAQWGQVEFAARLRNIIGQVLSEGAWRGEKPDQQEKYR